MVAAGGELGEDQSTAESLERQFDASWSLPLNVINALDEEKYIGCGLRDAALRQMILVKVSLTLLDVRLLKEIGEPIFDLTFRANAAAGKHPRQAQKHEMKTWTACASSPSTA